MTPSTREHLGCDELWSAAKGCHFVAEPNVQLAQTKVRQLDVPVTHDKNVVELEVTVSHLPMSRDDRGEQAPSKHTDSIRLCYAETPKQAPPRMHKTCIDLHMSTDKIRHRGRNTNLTWASGNGEPRFIM
jgi:hypothetical protein